MKTRLLSTIVSMILLTSFTQYTLGCFHTINIFHEQEILSNQDILKSILRNDYHGKIKEAFDFAYNKHLGQVRRFDSSAYIYHPLRVAKEVQRYGGDQHQIIAALLHDTLEDTNTTYIEIKYHFGKKVADLVFELTNIKSKVEKYGKINYLIKKLNTISSDALLIKLCDRLDNVSDFNLATDDFIKKYDFETKKLLAGLNRPLSDTHKLLISKIMTNLVAE